MAKSVALKEVHTVGYYHVGVAKDGSAIVAFYNTKNGARFIAAEFKDEEAVKKAVALANELSVERPLGTKKA